MKKGKLMQ